MLVDERKKLGMDFADPMNRSEWRGRLRGRLVKQAQPSVDLGHVTSIMHQIFISLYLKANIQNLVQNGKKSGLNFCMYTTLGQGQEITLTFNTHISSYIQLDVCSY